MSVGPISTFLNSSHFPDYIGKFARLPCKLLKFNGDRAIVQASDGGEIIVTLLPDVDVVQPYLEFVGVVTGPDALKMMAFTGFDDLSLEIVNDAILMIHDHRYRSIFGLE